MASAAIEKERLKLTAVKDCRAILHETLSVVAGYDLKVLSVETSNAIVLKIEQPAKLATFGASSGKVPLRWLAARQFGCLLTLYENGQSHVRRAILIEIAPYVWLWCDARAGPSVLFTEHA